MVATSKTLRVIAAPADMRPPGGLGEPGKELGRLHLSATLPAVTSLILRGVCSSSVLIAAKPSGKCFSSEPLKDNRYNCTPHCPFRPALSI